MSASGAGDDLVLVLVVEDPSAAEQFVDPAWDVHTVVAAVQDDARLPGCRRTFRPVGGRCLG